MFSPPTYTIEKNEPLELYGNLFIAATSYLGPLCAIALFSRENKYVRFHIKNAFFMVFLSVITFFNEKTLSGISTYFYIGSQLIIVALNFHGAINAISGVKKGPPIIGYIVKKFFEPNIQNDSDLKQPMPFWRVFLRIILLILLWCLALFLFWGMFLAGQAGFF